jgi:hypothetical protein
VAWTYQILYDPSTGREVRNPLSGLLDSSLGNPVIYHFGTNEISPWIRISTVLAIHCDPRGTLHLLQTIYFARYELASIMFPDLQIEFVVPTAGISNWVRSLSRCIEVECLCNRKVPTTSVWLIVNGVNSICMIGIERMRAIGVGIISSRLEAAVLPQSPIFCI